MENHSKVQDVCQQGYICMDDSILTRFPLELRALSSRNLAIQHTAHFQT